MTTLELNNHVSEEVNSSAQTIVDDIKKQENGDDGINMRDSLFLQKFNHTTIDISTFDESKIKNLFDETKKFLTPTKKNGDFDSITFVKRYLQYYSTISDFFRNDFKINTPLKNNISIFLKQYDDLQDKTKLANKIQNIHDVDIVIRLGRQDINLSDSLSSKVTNKRKENIIAKLEDSHIKNDFINYVVDYDTDIKLTSSIKNKLKQNISSDVDLRKKFKDQVSDFGSISLKNIDKNLYTVTSVNKRFDGLESPFRKLYDLKKQEIIHPIEEKFKKY